MGCICSKGATEDEEEAFQDDNEKDKALDISSVQLVAPAPSMKEEIIVKVINNVNNVAAGKDCAVRQAPAAVAVVEEGDAKTIIVERPSKTHHRWATMDVGSAEGRKQQQLSWINSMPHGAEAELISAGWPSWLTSVAADAIKGWVPRRADSFEKLDKIGQGTYSSVYKARDLDTGKIVAMKKVRFVNMDPESVRFMAREIYILRKLNHPNVMKLEGLVASRMSCSLFLVFEYMEHDLAGLAATPGIKFTEQQIKCYMEQLLHGLEHCHNHGVLHRDIKGSNLLINNDGILKIGDFGLATFYQPDQDQPLTSHVVTLWYRAPELLLGATEYGVAIDLWSGGCILAELFAGKPIMPGRTEVEQMHKIFKLCGSPSEDYWQKTKLPHATSFKPQHPYNRVLKETFKNFPSSALALVNKLLAIKPEDRGSATSALRSEFFNTEPLPCHPSSLPKYPPSKELDAKLRDEEARRQKAEAVKGRGPESVRRGSRDFKAVPTPEFIGSAQSKVTSEKFKTQDADCSGFAVEPSRGATRNGYTHSTSMVHPSAMGSSGNKNGGNATNTAELKTQISHLPLVAGELSGSSRKDRASDKDATMGYVGVAKKNRIHYSGPLMPTGGNIEDILKEHERQIQHAVRKSRLEKSGTKKNNDLTVQLPCNGRYV